MEPANRPDDDIDDRDRGVTAAGFERARKGFRDRLRRTRRLGWAGLLAALAEEWERERAYRTDFHLIPVGMAIGAVAVFGLGLSIWVLVGLGLLLGAFALLDGAAANEVRSSWGLLALACLAGMALARFELWRTDTIVFSGNATVYIEGRVTSHETDARGRSRYLVDIDTTKRPVLSRPPARARIVVGARHERLAAGDRYQGLVRLRPPSGPAFPGAYDFAFSPYFEGLGAYGFSLGRPEEPSRMAAHAEHRTLAERVDIAIARLRAGVTDRIRAVIPGQPGAVAAALVTGQRDGIDEETTEALRATGLAHILAISGLHVALVAGFALISVRRCLAVCGGLALIRPIKKIAAVAAIAVAAFYLVLSGASIATQRAFLMLLIMLLAVLADRPAITMRNVSLAAIIILAVTPHAVMTASFQMSFAATIALVGVFGAWSRWRGTLEVSAGNGTLRKAWLFIFGTAATALIAGLATAPFAIYHFQRFAPFGLVANLLVMPLFTLLVMPAALIGVLLIPFGLDAPAFHVMGFGLQILIDMATILQEWLPDRRTGLVEPFTLILMTVALLVFTIPHGRLRWTAVPILGLGLILESIRPSPPELLIFEDGKTFAMIDDGILSYSGNRPNGFVADQWDRAFLAEEEVRSVIPDLDGCDERLCRFETPSGIRVAYTTDYRLLGEACDTADIAFVARAARTRQCRSGAVLVTLRTLRRTGSLALRRDAATGEVIVERSIPKMPSDWNRHRHAPWPEYWRKPQADPSNSEPPMTTPRSGT